MAVDLKVSYIRAPSSGISFFWRAGAGHPAGAATRRASKNGLKTINCRPHLLSTYFFKKLFFAQRIVKKIIVLPYEVDFECFLGPQDAVKYDILILKYFTIVILFVLRQICPNFYY